VFHCKTGRVYKFTQHAVEILVNKKVKDKRINVQTESIKNSKSSAF
jgi:ribosomal protein L21E